MSEHKVILSPRSKERALYMLEENKLEFYVARTASKLDIKGAVRALSSEDSIMDFIHLKSSHAKGFQLGFLNSAAG